MKGVMEEIRQSISDEIAKELISQIGKDQYKYHEKEIFQELIAYIFATYEGHYVGDGDVQTVDFWKSLGTLETTSRDIAIKYLARYGKKNGKNKDDLFKAIHFIFFMLHVKKIEEEKQAVKGSNG